MIIFQFKIRIVSFLKRIVPNQCFTVHEPSSGRVYQHVIHDEWKPRIKGNDSKERKKKKKERKRNTDSAPLPHTLHPSNDKVKL